MASMATEERPVLDRTAVAEILGVKPKTISQYLVESRDAGRYADHPFPAPDGYIGRGPYWLRKRELEIRRWAESRPGQGAGGGRPRTSES
jgi:hypothetical protein